MYANFSNVLSVVITSDKENEIKTLNFDLTTGDEIPFEKLFVSSAPIKSIIAGGMYEGFAWEKLNEESARMEDRVDFYDMKNADTSEIEDEILLAVSKYDEIKDEIVYSFSESRVYIYNEEIKSSINLLDYINEIAIYKRYLTDESIFKDDSIGTKGLIVLTMDLTDTGYAEQISYGKIADNIFIEEVLWNWSELKEEDLNIVMKYVENLSEEHKVMLKQETPSNKGVIFQGEYYASKDSDKGYYFIQVDYYKAECSLSYFEEQAFKDYIQVKVLPRPEAGLNGFAPYMQDDYPEMQISEIENQTYYLSPTGEFLGNTIEEVESKIWE